MPSPPALLLIDIQQGLAPGMQRLPNGTVLNRNNHHAEDNAASLLQLWRQLQFPVYHLKHDSVTGSLLSPQKPTNQIDDRVKPLSSERLYVKHVNGGFTSTHLLHDLIAAHTRHIVMCGLTSDHCVSTNCRQASDLGFTVHVVADATATFDTVHWQDSSPIIPAEQIHDAAMSSLNGESAAVTTTEQIKRLVQSGKLSA